eukprot:m.159333 g.159333  ORF g.159333 m.159333 type:complete len:465 (-) comp15148_c0_seq1:297-1691(-)
MATVSVTPHYTQSNNGSATTVKAVALYDFVAETEQELSFKAGSVLVVHDWDHGKQWWRITNADGDSGFAPANRMRVEPKGDPPLRRGTVQQSSTSQRKSRKDRQSRDLSALASLIVGKPSNGATNSDSSSGPGRTGSLFRSRNVTKESGVKATEKGSEDSKSNLPSKPDSSHETNALDSSLIEVDVAEDYKGFTADQKNGNTFENTAPGSVASSRQPPTDRTPFGFTGAKHAINPVKQGKGRALPSTNKQGKSKASEKDSRDSQSATASVEMPQFVASKAELELLKAEWKARCREELQAEFKAELAKEQKKQEEAAAAIITEERTKAIVMQREADEMYLEIAILKSNNERLANRVSELEQILIEVTRPTTMEADEDVGHVHEILNISNHEGPQETSSPERRNSTSGFQFEPQTEEVQAEENEDEPEERDALSPSATWESPEDQSWEDLDLDTSLPYTQTQIQRF